MSNDANRAERLARIVHKSTPSTPLDKKLNDLAKAVVALAKAVKRLEVQQ